MGKTTRLTTEEFIKRCYNKFGNKFDYSKVKYKNNKTKVCIICPEHGEFYVRPHDFLHSMFGCSKCSDLYNGKKKTKSKDIFLLKAKEIHGDKYDYSKVEYENRQIKVCIICPEHGEFWQTPYQHLKGNGCPKCANNIKHTREEFVQKAKEIHGDKYDYSKVEYKGNKIKVCIICSEHGEFWQTPNSHLNGCGCPKCGGEKRRNNIKHTREEFIKKAKEVHGNKYDYSKVEYKGCFVKVCIICPEHGEFWQTPNSHLNGCGCSKCSKKNKPSKKEFIEKAQIIHGEKYDYSKVEYVNNYTKVCIICPEHGEFWQTPNSHLNGNGCSSCNEHKLEKEMRQFLKEKNIRFVEHCTKKWLGRQHLDFYLPDYNVAIECQGIQHFEPVEFFGGEEQFKYVISLDYIKYKLCKNNGIKILYYSNKEYKNMYQNIYNKNNFFIDKNNLINNIYNCNL